MEAGELLGKSDQNSPKWQKLGRGTRNIASVSFRQLPRAAVEIRGTCGRKIEAVKLLGAKARNISLNGRNYGGGA